MEINWRGLLIGILITCISYMLVPVILKINHGNYDEKAAKKIALSNSIIVGFIYMILTIEMSDGNTTWNAAPAFLYFGINYWLLTGGKKDKKENSLNKKNDNHENMVIDKKKIKNNFCKQCGGKLDENKKCEKCGKQYLNIKKIKNFILIFILILSIVLNVYQFLKYKKLEEDIEVAANEIADICSDTMIDSMDYQEKADFLDENIVFVIEGDEDHYFTYDCMMSIDEEFSYWAYNKEQAIYKGYKKGSCN